MMLMTNDFASESQNNSKQRKKERKEDEREFAVAVFQSQSDLRSFTSIKIEF